MISPVLRVFSASIQDGCQPEHGAAESVEPKESNNKRICVTLHFQLPNNDNFTATNSRTSTLYNYSATIGHMSFS